MGVTIRYRGTMNDIRQVETMEDRVLDLVFSLGGRATIWRSYSDHQRDRVVRGLIINLEPGQDTFSLLVSPEGHLTPPFQIMDAENGPVNEPPYCVVKTQFGSVQGHVTIVHLLDAIRQQYCANLEVSDEGEYYETRDIDKLIHKRQLLSATITSMAEGLRVHGLNKEAAEDPSIFSTRIERIAALVHQKLMMDRIEPTGRVDNADDFHEPSLVTLTRGERSLDCDAKTRSPNNSPRTFIKNLNVS